MAKRYLATTLTAKDLASPVFRKTALALGGLGTIAASVGAVQLGRQLVRGLEAAVNASAKYEGAATRLAVALANQGENTRENRDDLRGYAEQLSRLSLATETQILGSIAQAKALGASNEAAKRLTAAATDLASATGVDMETAFRQVNRTLGGYAGELGEIFPELKKLTAEQLKAGAAADVLKAKVGGAGAAGANTLEGALNNLNSEFDRLLVTIGEPVAEVLRVFVEVLTEIVGDLNDSASSSDSLRESVISLGVATAEATLSMIELAQAANLGLLKANAAARLGLDPISNLLAEIAESDPILGAFESRVRETIGRLEALRAAGASDPGSEIENQSVAKVQAALEADLANRIQFLQLRRQAIEQFNEEALSLEEERLRLEFERETEQAEKTGANKLLIASKYEQRLSNLRDKFAQAEIQRKIAVAQASVQFLQAAFGNTKAVQYAAAVVNTAEAITDALPNIPLAALAGAMGAAQIATIASTQPPALRGFLEGGIIPGVDVGRRDSVLFAGRPGEAVLPKELTDFLLTAAGQGGGPVEIRVQADLPILVEQINTGVRAGNVALVSTELAGSRARR